MRRGGGQPDADKGGGGRPLWTTLFKELEILSLYTCILTVMFSRVFSVFRVSIFLFNALAMFVSFTAS